MSVSDKYSRTNANSKTDSYFWTKLVLDVIGTSLALHKTASQQRISGHTKESESFLADKTVIEADLRQLRTDTQAKIA